MEAVPSKYLHGGAKKSSSFKRKQPPRKVVQKNASVAEIYFISTAEEQGKDYDSIEVIDERRNKSFGQMGVGSSTSSINAPAAADQHHHHHSGTGPMRNSNTNLERTDTVIYRDSYKRAKAAAAVDESGGVRGDTRDIGTNATQDTNALHQLTTKAEVEQRRSSNVSETDNSDVR